MQLQLHITAGPDAGRKFNLEANADVRVGRGDDCEFQLNDPRASRTHCIIKVKGGKGYITDCSSSWGTVVNGETVGHSALSPGDTIMVGTTQLTFEVGTSAQATTIPPRRRPPVEATRIEVSPQAKAKSPRKQAAGGKKQRAPKERSAKEHPANKPHTKKAVKKADSTPTFSSYFPEVSQIDELVGKQLLRYEVGKIIARAKTGILFRARDTKKKCDVALKVLWPELSQDESEVNRFIRAIKTMLPIRHKNLISLHAAGKTGPYCWTASEFVKGESLTQTIHRIGVNNMLEWQYGYRVALHVARALEAAAEHKIVHRNITPQNIMIRSEDRVVKLGDLMLAKALEGTQAEKITRAGELVGQLEYLSPEETASNSHIDTRSDIYHLGAAVYAVLTGRPPFEGRSPVETIMKIQTEEPEKPTKYHLSIPPMLEGVILRMLAKRPEDRYATPTHLVKDLERVGKFQGMTDI